MRKQEKINPQPRAIAIIGVDIICHTQTMTLNNYPSPSGYKYEQLQKIPFRVTDKEDIAFFKQFPQRFKVSNVLLNIIKSNPKPSDTVKDEFKKYLDGVDGLSSRSKESLMKEYTEKGELIDEIIQGGQPESLSTKQYNILKDLIVPSDV